MRRVGDVLLFQRPGPFLKRMNRPLETPKVARPKSGMFRCSRFRPPREPRDLSSVIALQFQAAAALQLVLI